MLKIITLCFLAFIFIEPNKAESFIMNPSTSQIQTIDFILIEKSRRKMHVYHRDVLLKTYSIALGFNPQGAKERMGDGKTPEGIYAITVKNAQSAYHRSLGLSYPNAADAARAKKLGVNPGGHIMIHGLRNDLAWLGPVHTFMDWTQGCIAVSNPEIEEIFEATSIGTRVEIRP
ncbi:MAG: murein L,D-transpeptidase family protein [Holosporales bacterium]